MNNVKGQVKDLDWEMAEAEHFMVHEERYTRMLDGFAQMVLEAADVQATDHVLDIGCGAGAMCLLAARAAPEGRVLGVDISEPMLARGREHLAEHGIDNVTLQLGDAQLCPLPSDEFDVAMSRLGVMFFTDPRAAFANVCGAMRKGGRLAFVTWKDVTENENMMVPLTAALEHIPAANLGDPEALSPFSLADPTYLRATLEDAGWVDVDLRSVTDRMWWGTDADDAAQFIRSTGRAQIMLRNVDEEAQAKAFAAVRDALRPFETSDGVYLGGACWLATARRPA